MLARDFSSALRPVHRGPRVASPAVASAKLLSTRRINATSRANQVSASNRGLHPRLVCCWAEQSEANRQLREPGAPIEASNTGEDEQHDDGTIRLPLKALAEEAGARRSKLVMFTCNKCGGRSSRAVNPLAWEKGLVFGQCSHCSVWHVLSAKNPKIYEEIRYADVEEPSRDVASEQ